MTVKENRRNKGISLALAVACVLLVSCVVYFAISDGLRADATGTAATGTLALILGGLASLALFIASVWLFVRSERGK
jgi:hypothetical protein